MKIKVLNRKAHVEIQVMMASLMVHPLLLQHPEQARVPIHSCRSRRLSIMISFNCLVTWWQNHERPAMCGHCSMKYVPGNSCTNSRHKKMFNLYLLFCTGNCLHTGHHVKANSVIVTRSQNPGRSSASYSCTLHVWLKARIHSSQILQQNLSVHQFALLSYCIRSSHPLPPASMRENIHHKPNLHM